MRHTKAPWTYFHNHEGDYTIFAGIDPDKETTICFTTEEADAQLISAAPELLGCLIERLEEIGVDPFGDTDGYSRKIQKALEAIKKATS